MCRTCFLILFLFIFKLGYSQTDSIHISVFDSLGNLDSFQLIKDSLTINAWGDSLKLNVQNKFKPDSLRLITKIDSLQSLHLSTEPYSSRLDSLLTSRQNKFKEIGEKQQELSAKTKARVNRWQQAVRGRLDSLGVKGNVPGVDLPQGKEINVPALDLPEMPSLSPGDFGDVNL